MKIARVILPQAHLFPLDYRVPADLKVEIGQIVIVPFRNKRLAGVVIEEPEENAEFKLKDIESVFSYEPLSESLLHFIKRAAEYYVSELGSVVKLLLPVELVDKKHNPYKQEFSNISLPALSADQEEALKKIQAHQGVSMLQGITGSGKTEIYFYLLKKALEEGKQALLMLPEIALSKQILQRFKERFGTEAVVWNSSISRAKKISIFQGIMEGTVKIIIGTRSSLFLPYKNLGTIIVDEEHDNSYKQEENILYNARDMAILRGHFQDISVILGSATPSLETFHNTILGKYLGVKLNSRFGAASLPDIEIIDMRSKKKDKSTWISEELKNAIAGALASRQQVMLFLNRKGYAPLLVCSSCGHRASCGSCSTSLVYHKSDRKLICHHCGYHTAVYTGCLDCQSQDSMVPCGPGVERIYEEVSAYFPNHTIQIMTREEMSSAKKANEILSNIVSGKIDIIIGTQIITKGYHFPKLTTVGVVDIDVGLAGGDLRSAEKTFQLLYQVGGRAGREEIKGKMYLQTFNPHSNLISLLKNHDFEGFMKAELEIRKSENMPPITRLATLIISDKNEIMAKKIAYHLISKLPKSDRVMVLGPVAAILSLLKNKYRYRILLIADKKFNLQAYISQAMKDLSKVISGKIKIDMDPYNFY